MTQEDCNEVEKFYKPFLDKNESKFRVHYQMLQQMTRQADLADLLSSHEQTPGFSFTPSLAALDDAQALMGKEWKRNEPWEEIPRQYSTPCGHLTLTQPRQDYMRIDSMLNITPEGSQNEDNIPTTLRRDVDQTEFQQTPKTSEQRVADNHPSATALDWAAETPYSPITLIPRRTSDGQVPRTSRLFDGPRSIQSAREEGQEEVLESVRHFFAPVNYNGAIGSGQEQAVQIRSGNGAPSTTVGAP